MVSGCFIDSLRLFKSAAGHAGHLNRFKFMQMYSGNAVTALKKYIEGVKLFVLAISGDGIYAKGTKF